MRAWRVSLAVVPVLAALLVSVVSAETFRTENFVVMAPDAAFARKVGEEAERFRRELAELWLGRELAAWPQPCPITVEIAPHAGGETSFAFVPDGSGGSRPVDWRMRIYGPPERILDSVLPHEVTHTIFATHYGRPLPRWADEGACTTVEHASERERNHRMLIEFLTTGRGIPFNHMFAMKQYPSDILPLYSQGYSLARYLIMQKGHRHFVKFVGEGMDREVPGQEPKCWNDVAQQYYGYEDLSDLQIQWLAWVKKGCPQLDSADTAATATAANTTSIPQPPTSGGESMVAVPPARDLSNAATVATDQSSESWYLRQSRLGSAATTQRAATGGAAPSGYRPGTVRRPSGGSTIWR